MKTWKKILMWGAGVTAVVAATIGVCYWVVSRAAEGMMYEAVENVPSRKVAVVLGTSPVSTWNGRRNRYFDSRIRAAADLYRAKKVERIIVSGGDYTSEKGYRDNPGYDEPQAMRDSLVKLGVLPVHIVLDYDGTTTMRSLAKLRDVYHVDSVIIISQQYHNERALYQAQRLGIDAIAYNAPTPGGASWLRNRARECLARIKTVFNRPSSFEFTDTVNPFVIPSYEAEFGLGDYNIPAGELKYEGHPMVGHFFDRERVDSLWIETNDKELDETYERIYLPRLSEETADEVPSWVEYVLENRKIWLCTTHPRLPRVVLANKPENLVDFQLMWEGDLDGDGLDDFGLYCCGSGNSQWRSYLIMTFERNRLCKLIDYTPDTDYSFRGSGLEVAEPGSRPGWVKINCAGVFADQVQEFPRHPVPFKPRI
ncbi:MAG: YdcF family protein [Bacteroidales bacterium]|nr:YdcF family protein [Bacteroidales bacterium]